MSLDATVYKRRDEVPIPASDMGFVSIDEKTGEWDFANRDVYERWHDRVKVLSKRLGNIALVDLLREEANRIFAGNPEPALVRKVLFSGTHAGDVLTHEDLLTIKREISVCRERVKDSPNPYLSEFLDNMCELIEASERHGNPIVFT